MVKACEAQSHPSLKLATIVLEPKPRQLPPRFSDQMAFVKSTSFSLVLLAMVLLALAASHVEASSFTAFSGPGCSGNSERLSRCGCSNINRRAGYRFSYTGQTAAVYNQPGCNGVAHTRFGSSANGCTPFGWQSIFIQC